MALLVGLDIGTTTIKAAVYDSDRQGLVRLASRPTPVTSPGPGLSEHDPEHLWETAAACLKEAAGGLPIAGLAISSLAEAGLPVDRDGRALYPVIAWYDRRTETQAAWLERTIPPEDLHRITGQRASPSFGLCKWLWIRENHPDIARKTARWLSVPDYLHLRLTGRAATDLTIASRTLLFDPQQREWSPALLEIAGLEPGQLPPVAPSGMPVGGITPAAAGETSLPQGTACVLGGHDHLCAALAVGAGRPGVMVDSSGTAQSVLLVLPGFLSGRALVDAGFACYPYTVPGTFVLKGGLKAAGGALVWLARALAGPDLPVDELFRRLEGDARAGIGKTAGPIWLPHLDGSGTPEGDRYSRGALVGVRSEHGRADLFRGMLEGLAFWLRRNLEEMGSLSGQKIEAVRLTGGTARLELLDQLKADVLGSPVAVPDLPEAAAVGAALLAGVGSGAFPDVQAALSGLKPEETVYTPDPARARWYNQLYEEVYRPLYGSLRPLNRALERISGK